MSSPDSPPPNPLHVLRKRANTKTLLGDDYAETTTELIDPPRPLSNASEYNQNVLKARLKYAHFTLNNTKRKLSPLGMHALKLYKEACAHLLDLEDGETFELDEELQQAKVEWISAIRVYEESAQYRTLLNVTRSQDAQTMQEQILALQTTSFYARYGDYLADVCTRLKREAEMHKVCGWQSLQKKYWTDIHQELEGEKAAYKTLLNGGLNHDECPTHMAVTHACRRVGFKIGDMLAAIRHYSIRNELVHVNLLTLVKEGNFSGLAKILHDDYCDMPRLSSPQSEFPSQLMLTLLQGMVDLWFEYDTEDFENYTAWSASAELKNLRKELKAGDEAQVNKRVKEEIMKAVKKALKNAENEKKVASVIENLSLLPGKKTKRVASSQLEEEMKNVKKMRVAWSKIEGLATGLRKMSDTYIIEHGELRPPPELIPDPSLDD